MRLLEKNIREIEPRLPETVNPSRVEIKLHDISARIGDGLHMRRPCVITLPGGGYAGLSDRESDAIAVPFFNAGFQSVTLYYSVAPDRYPAALLQVMALVAWLRRNAEELNVDPGSIYVCGFSAGGHLAASAGTLWKEPVVRETLGVDSRLCRPDGMILCYPVILYGELGNKGSFHNLLGEGLAEDEYGRLSLERHVDADTPPAFLWHTWSDEAVPVENSLRMADALRRHGVSFEMHIFPYGCHGLSTANEESSARAQSEIRDGHVAHWVELACEWIRIQKARSEES